MPYYLKFPADTGTEAGNNKLIQLSGIATTGNVNIAFEFAENVTDPTTTASKSAYLYDGRRQLNSVTLGSGGYFLESNNAITQLSTSNYQLNGSASTNTGWRTALANDIYSFDSGVQSDGVIAVGARYNQIASFPLLALKSIIITDSAGAHVVDMSSSGGTSNTFTSTDGVITLALFGFTGTSHWIFYSSGASNYADTLLAGSYAHSGSLLNSSVGYSSELQAGAFTHSGSVLSSVTARSSTLQAGSYGHSGSALGSAVGYSSTLQSGAFSYSGSELQSIISNGAQNYSDTLLGGSFSHAGSALQSVIARNSTLLAGSYSHAGSNLSASLAFYSTLNGGSYSHFGSMLQSTVSGQVTVSIEGYTITFAADDVSAAFAADMVGGSYQSDYIEAIKWLI